MTFTEFIETYKHLSGKELASVANGKTFELETVSLSNFKKLQHTAVELGLIPDNAAEVLRNKFNVELDFSLDAKAEGLTVSEWACKRDPYSIANQKKDDTPDEPGGISFASRITKEDLEKYKIPYIVDEAEDEEVF